MIFIMKQTSSESKVLQKMSILFRDFYGIKVLILKKHEWELFEIFVARETLLIDVENNLFEFDQTHNVQRTAKLK